jgi:hypothetical protein
MLRRALDGGRGVTVKAPPITEAQFLSQVVQLAEIRGWQCSGMVQSPYALQRSSREASARPGLLRCQQGRDAARNARTRPARESGRGSGTGRRSTRPASPPHRLRGRPLDLDRPSRSEGLRACQRRGDHSTSPSSGIRGVQGSDTRWPDSRSPLSGSRVRQPGSPGAGHPQRELGAWERAQARSLSTGSRIIELRPQGGWTDGLLPDLSQ